LNFQPCGNLTLGKVKTVISLGPLSVEPSASRQDVSRVLDGSTGDQKSDLEQLLSRGYVESTESHPGSNFKLTAKGGEFLGKRGAGLNEA
jgi:CTP-dependent riboflavin kinase